MSYWQCCWSFVRSFAAQTLLVAGCPVYYEVGLKELRYTWNYFYIIQYTVCSYTVYGIK